MLGPIRLIYPHQIILSIQESGRSCIYVLEISILLLSTIFRLNFGTVPEVRYFCFTFYNSLFFIT